MRATEPMHNWAGNVRYSAAELVTPRSLGDLQDIVAKASRVHAVGSRHSFSRVADTEGELVDLSELPQSVEVDAARGTASVAAGMSYGDVALALHDQGWALSNLASLPHITVAGGCATGTHGSGDGNQGLAAAVHSMTVVGPDGELHEMVGERDQPRFAAARVGLGGMGIVAELVLSIEPTYDVEQRVYEDLRFDVAITNLDEVMASAYSVSLFTDFSAPRFTQVWRKRRIEPGERHDWPTRWFGATAASAPRHPVPGANPEHCTVQGGEPGPWFARLPHFRWDSPPSAGAELQTEYLVDRTHAPAVFTELRALAPEISAVLRVCECRSIAADDCWLSPAYGRSTIGFHFTWQPELSAVWPVLAAIERRLEPFGPRPHWGKLHRFPRERLVAVYPRLNDYNAERVRFDPDGVFSNASLERLSA